MTVRVGVMLPIFQHRATMALGVARRAEALGIDGVFCYDHLWPMGQPGRPALAPFPVLGLVAATTARISLGTLVARVGLVPDSVLVSEFAALDALAPGRVVAGMGTGDRLSAGENEAYGVDFGVAGERRERLRQCVRTVLDRGVSVWVGGGGEATKRIAREEGAVLNLWDASPSDVAQEARRVEVTWGGAASGRDLAPMVARLAEAGATWAVFASPVDLDELAAAGAAVR